MHRQCLVPTGKRMAHFPSANVRKCRSRAAFLNIRRYRGKPCLHRNAVAPFSDRLCNALACPRRGCADFSSSLKAFRYHSPVVRDVNVDERKTIYRFLFNSRYKSCAIRPNLPCPATLRKSSKSSLANEGNLGDFLRGNRR